MLSDYKGKILTKGFCYSDKIQSEESRPYHTTDDKSKKLLYITEDITKLVNKYGSYANVTAKSFFNSKYGDSFWCKKIFQNENFQKIRDKVL